jgi:hypothetical protein
MLDNSNIVLRKREIVTGGNHAHISLRKRSQRNNRVLSSFSLGFIETLQYGIYGITGRNLLFISNYIKSLKEEYSSFKDFFVLYTIKNLSGLHETTNRDIEIYIPDTTRV